MTARRIGWLMGSTVITPRPDTDDVTPCEGKRNALGIPKREERRVKRIFQWEHHGLVEYYDLARIIRIRIPPTSGEKDYDINGVITFENGTTEQITRQRATEVKDAWIAYIEGSA
jgi:hypothetical protein